MRRQVRTGPNRETDQGFCPVRLLQALGEVLCRGAVNLLRNRSKRQHGWPDQAMEDRAQRNRTISLYGLQHLNHFHHGGSHPNASSGWHGAQFQMLTGQQHSLKRGMRGGVALLLRDCCISTTRSAFVTYRAMLETNLQVVNHRTRADVQAYIDRILNPQH